MPVAVRILRIMTDGYDFSDYIKVCIPVFKIASFGICIELKSCDGGFECSL